MEGAEVTVIRGTVLPTAATVVETLRALGAELVAGRYALVAVTGASNVTGESLPLDEVVELGLWDCVRVAPEAQRAFEAGPDGMDLIAVGGPKPEGGDGLPGEANWPDRP